MEVNNTSTSESSSVPTENESVNTVPESGTDRPVEEVLSSSSNAPVAQVPARETRETDRPAEEVLFASSNAQVTQAPAAVRRYNAMRPRPLHIINAYRREGIPFPRIPQNFFTWEGDSDSDGEMHEFMANELGLADKSGGLSAERIDRFHHFNAGADLAGKRCQICMDDLTIGSRIVRLDCHEKHVMCETCVDNWFGNHKTCPMCRKAFQ